ncbi:hypothetical protein Tco_1152133 [Tanacetum coccineum]
MQEFNSHSSTMLPQGGLGGARPTSPNTVTSAEQQQPLMSTTSKILVKRAGWHVKLRSKIGNAKVDEIDQQQSLSDDATTDFAQNVGLSKNAANEEDPKVAYASDM